ncbi:ribokinase [Albitalea terrae]|uniref:Deoxyribokinase n=2 Tax=Piscinibacter terrae TaxID=2496871 RepID=A0A3N7HLE9_9BURK|nr:ribokinase [Albitalea terrae]
MLRCARLPQPGETVHGEDFRTAPGGKGANQAVAAARLGGRVEFIGCVGDDAFGTEARTALEREGVGTTHLRTRADVPTGVAMILVEQSGQNSIALAAGANACLDLAQVDDAAAAIAGASLLVCQLESPLDAVRHAIGIARRHGVLVLLNPAPAQTLPPALLAEVDILVPNESEAALLVGADAPREPTALALALKAQGPDTVIVTLGEDGICLADPDGVRLRAAPAAKAVDTTGAGDTFIGAFAVALQEGQGTDSAAAFAQRAAALSVARHGAMASMPTRDECESAR